MSIQFLLIQYLFDSVVSVRSFARVHGSVTAASLHILVGDPLPAAVHLHMPTFLTMWTMGGAMSLALPHDPANWRASTVEGLLRETLRALEAALRGDVEFGAFSDAGGAEDAGRAIGATLSTV